MSTINDVNDDVVVVTNAEAKRSTPELGLIRLVGAYNEKLFLAEHYMEKGWVGTAHSHPHEQMVYVVFGRLQVRCGDKVFEVASGDSFVVRGGVEHQATALESSHVIDVFTPSRNDYI
jgi:quercetin dioxygenase-like cupin family protein